MLTVHVVSAPVGKRESEDALAVDEYLDCFGDLPLSGDASLPLHDQGPGRAAPDHDQAEGDEFLGGQGA